MKTLGLFCLAIGIIVSIKERTYLMMWRSSSEPQQSHLSNAIAQLVGTAGGIYLSFELLLSFLKVPENWLNETGFIVEPLALCSLVLAIVQPFAIRAWIKIRK